MLLLTTAYLQVIFMAEKVKKIQEVAQPSWQTVFCSLAIILVAFFVMLCSYATLEQGKMEAVVVSFRGAVGLFTSGILFDKGEGIVVPSPDNRVELQEQIATPISNLLKGKEDIDDIITLKIDPGFIRLKILTSFLFKRGETELSTEAQNALSEISEILSVIQVPIRIEAHTDDTPAFKEGWEISTQRAATVMRFLHQKAEIPFDRISAVGLSQYRPFLPNKTEEQRRQNRRVEIIIPLTTEIVHDIASDSPPSFRVWKYQD